jgi:transcriptional regulator with XRE-family HTH domain
MGDRIVRARESKGWKQLQLAKHVGISQKYASQLEQDKVDPGAKMIIRLAEALGVSTDYLLRGEQPSLESDQSLLLEVRRFIRRVQELKSTMERHDT